MASSIFTSCIGSQLATQQQQLREASPGYKIRASSASASASSPLQSLFSGKQKLILNNGRRSENSLLQQSNQKGRNGRGGFCLAHVSLVVSAVTSGQTVSSTPLDLEVAETYQENSRVCLSITVPPQVCKDTYNEIIREFSKKTKVPGFRPGKRIPESVLVNYIGPQQIRSSAVEAILKKTLPEALSSVAGRALKESEHILSKFKDLEASFSPEAPLRYDVAVDVSPEVKWTRETTYKSLKVNVELDLSATPEEAAEAELRSRLKDMGSLQVAPDRGIEMGDVAVIDISANRLNADGTVGDKVLSAEQKGFQLDTEDFTNFIPGFVEALLGLKRGETQTFDLPFPQTWQQEALRGINARFIGSCKEIFVRNLPELDDNIAPKIVQGLTTLNQVKEVLLEKHRIKQEDAKRQATQLAITDELAKVTEVDVPNSLLEEQGRQMYAAKLIELQATAKLSKEQVVSLSSQEMVNNFLLSQKEKIRDTVKQTLAVAEIYRLENLKYSEEELESEVKSAIDEFKRYNQEYDEKRIREQAGELLEGSKVLDYLIKHSEITYTSKQA